MKRIILMAGLLLAAIGAQAQFASPSYGPVTIMNVVSNAAGTAVTNGLIDCRKQSTVGVQITVGCASVTASGGGLAAGDMLYYFYRSADGTTLDAIPQIVGSPAQSGATNKTFSTNLVSSGMGYFKVVSTNVAATTGIVSTVTYGVKIGTAQ